MISTIAKLEHKVGDNVYQFHCANNAPLGEVHDALTNFKAYVFGLLKEQHEKEKQEADSLKTETPEA